MNEIISAAVLLILIMDPLGNLPIFMSVLKHTEPKRRRSLAKLRSRKEDRANGVEVALFNHALHENGADHTAPADKTNIFHKRFFPAKMCAV